MAHRNHQLIFTVMDYAEMEVTYLDYIDLDSSNEKRVVRIAALGEPVSFSSNKNSNHYIVAGQKGLQIYEAQGNTLLYDI